MVPPDLFPTLERPDIVLVREGRKILIIEITVPLTRLINSANDFKTSKYQILVLLSELEAREYIIYFIPVEVQ